ncbi:MAG: type II toxin-antitoxin system VapC family toxin [Holophagales bacterium]|nr:type II toxin-antitoxin system VapC family toxin [Holophagales bacterium]MYC10612.1 type II toxin-antitoxin system VapC family toxin [Holophagales bacterium]
MALVIDASVAAAWCLRDEEGSLRAGAVMARVDEEEAIVPSLFWHEIVNILIVAERQKRIERIGADRCLEDLRDLGLVTDSTQDYQATLALARRRNLSGYDAAYLETAKRHDAEVATLDKAMARAAVAESIATTWA